MHTEHSAFHRPLSHTSEVLAAGPALCREWLLNDQSALLRKPVAGEESAFLLRAQGGVGIGLAATGRGRMADDRRASDDVAAAWARRAALARPGRPTDPAGGGRQTDRGGGWLTTAEDFEHFVGHREGLVLAGGRPTCRSLGGLATGVRTAEDGGGAGGPRTAGIRRPSWAGRRSAYGRQKKGAERGGCGASAARRRHPQARPAALRRTAGPSPETSSSCAGSPRRGCLMRALVRVGFLARSDLLHFQHAWCWSGRSQ